jgi:drug/metabolite transporter (DMT)-like permease
VVLVIPACFDLLGTALSGIGLLFTTVSVYQLVRCSVIIVTALLKAVVLRQPLKQYQWVGIGLNSVAMALVSSTSFIGGVEGSNADNGSGRDPRIGIMFILLSCCVQGKLLVP